MTRARASKGRVRRSPKGGGGFTLIELLVVIAVIGIIAAIIYPVYKSVSERGRRTACISNFRQIVLGLRAYTSDHGGLLPPAPQSDPTHTGAPPHARAGSKRAYQVGGLGALVPDYIEEGVLVGKASVQDPPTLLPDTAPPAEVQQEKDLEMMYWQRVRFETQTAWVKASYHFRPDLYSLGDGITQPGRISADLDDPQLAATLPGKLLPGTDPAILSEWNHPIIFDYNHRSKDRAGVLYANLDGATRYEAASTVIIPSPWPWP